MYLQIVCTILTVYFGVGSGVPYKDCGSSAKLSKVAITDCTGNICPLKHNTNVTFQVDFKTASAAKSATSVVHGIVEHIPLPFPLKNPDACKDCGLICPLAAGKMESYKSDIFVDSKYPNVKVIVKWELKDEAGNDIFCLEVPAVIED